MVNKIMQLFPENPEIAPDEAEKLAWLTLSRTENVGPITFYKLVSTYGSAAKALEALPELAKRGGRKKPLRAPSKSDIEKELKALHKINGRIITAACPNYPELLKNTDDAPPVLSVIGNTDLLNSSTIAMVGARNASHNGRSFAQKLAHELGGRGQVIASGLARGIDTAAHLGSIDTGTIAVVAGGIDVIYPQENTKLYEQICDTGLIIAESPFGQKPFAQSFPKRNRIVSGLSKGTIVVEANMRSGSLITARLAGEHGREVMAVPGHPADPRAAGTNHLIREGATLVRSADDVLETLMNFQNEFREPILVQTPYETPVDMDDNPPENAADKILSHLSFQPTPVDELLRLCQLSVATVQTVLLEQELAGRLKRLPGNKICLIEG